MGDFKLRAPFTRKQKRDQTASRDTARAMSQENVEVVRSHLEAWNRRDKAAYVASFRSDAEIDWSRARALYSDVYRGREQQKALLGGVLVDV